MIYPACRLPLDTPGAKPPPTTAPVPTHDGKLYRSHPPDFPPPHTIKHVHFRRFPLSLRRRRRNRLCARRCRVVEHRNGHWGHCNRALQFVHVRCVYSLLGSTAMGRVQDPVRMRGRSAFSNLAPVIVNAQRMPFSFPQPSSYRRSNRRDSKRTIDQARIAVPYHIALPEPMSAQRRLAVVLGVGAYTALPPLPQCEAGAEDVASALAARGYDVTTVVNGDRRRVQASFRDVVSAAGRAGGATLVAYIAAHGVSCCGENYIVPLDGVADTDMGAFRALGVGGQWMRERGGTCTGRCTCSNAPSPPWPSRLPAVSPLLHASAACCGVLSRVAAVGMCRGVGL